MRKDSPHPRVSVVIASYNHGAFIEAAIQSILDQDFQRFEIVITDDCSTDNSVEIIRKFRDPRIKLNVFEENYGPSIAMNDAILRSEGEFMANLGSDDFFLPEKLTRQLEFLDFNPSIAAVFSLPKLVDEQGDAIDGGFREFTFPFPYAQPSRQEWLRHFFFNGNCLCHPSVLIRRSIHDEIGVYNRRLRLLADFDLWVRLCMKHEIHVMQETMVGRRLLTGGKNLSAPRTDTVKPKAFERSQIWQHYRALSQSEFLEIFGADVLANGLNPSDPHLFNLSKLALSKNTDLLNLFALTTLFETEGLSDRQCSEFVQINSEIDLFGLFSRMKTEEQKLAIADLNSRLEKTISDFQGRLEQNSAEYNKRIKNISDLNQVLEQNISGLKDRLQATQNDLALAVERYKLMCMKIAELFSLNAFKLYRISDRGIKLRSVWRYPFSSTERRRFRENEKSRR